MSYGQKSQILGAYCFQNDTENEKDVKSGGNGTVTHTRVTSPLGTYFTKTQQLT